MCKSRALTLKEEEEEEDRSIERGDREGKRWVREANCSISAYNDKLEVENVVTPLWMTW